MAEISKDTTAILDRLKREGSLTRNGGDGKNSIKQVNINLEKFGVLFQGIQNELANLNKTFGQMLGASAAGFQGPLPQAQVEQETLEPPTVQFDEEQLRKLGLDEETIKLQKEAATLNIKNNLEDEKLRAQTEQKRKEDDADKRRKERSEKAKDYLQNKTITGQVLTNPLSFFTKLLKGAAVAFVGFNVVRGIVDQWTGGKFTEFVEGIDYAAIGEGMKTFSAFLADSPWTGFTAALLAWSAIDFGIPLALSVTGEVLRTSMLAKALSGGVAAGIETSKGFMSTVLSIRGAAFTALGIGVAIGGAKIADYVRENMLGMTKEQIANENLVLDGGDAVDVLGMTAAGATIGMMFGPKGALVGAILGFAFGVGKKAYDYISSSAEEKIEFDAMGEDLARENAKTAKLMLEQHANGTRELTEKQIEALTKQAEGPSQELINKTNDEIAEQRNNLENEMLKIQNRNITQRVSTGQGGTIRVEEITDASELMRLEKKRDDDLAAKKAELAKIEERMNKRVELGYAAFEDMEYVDPEGFAEKFYAFFGQQSSGRVESRAEKAAAEKAALENFFAVSTLDEEKGITGTKLSSVMAKVESGALRSHEVVTILRTGDNITQLFDNSDKSSNNTTNVSANVGGPMPQPNG